MAARNLNLLNVELNEAQELDPDLVQEQVVNVDLRDFKPKCGKTTDKFKESTETYLLELTSK